MKKKLSLFLSLLFLFFSFLQAADKLANRAPVRFDLIYYKNTYFSSHEHLRSEMLLNGSNFGLVVDEEALNNEGVFSDLSKEYLIRHWRKVGKPQGLLGAPPTLDLDQHYENHFSSHPSSMKEAILQNGEQFGFHISEKQVEEWNFYEQARQNYLIRHLTHFKSQGIVDEKKIDYMHHKAVLDHTLPSNFNECHYFSSFYSNNPAFLDEDIRSKAHQFGFKNVEGRLQHPFEKRFLRSAYLERHCRGYAIPSGEYARIYEPFLYTVNFKNYLKKLNPSWPDFLAEAWVDYVGNADHLASVVGSHYESSPLIFQTEGNCIELYPYPIPKNEFCLLFTLGISPSSFHEIVLNKDERATRDSIASNIYALIVAGLFPETLKTGESNLLIKYLHESEARRQEKVDEINNFLQATYTFDELLNLKDCEELRDELRELDHICFYYETGLIKWCERPSVIRQFLSYELENSILNPDSEGKYLSCFSLSMIAKSLNKNLIIYKKSAISDHLDVLFRHSAESASSEVYHILFSGYYCQPLYTKPASFNVPNMNAPSSLFSDSLEAGESYTDNDVLTVCALIKNVISDAQPDRNQIEQDIIHYTSLRNLEIQEINEAILLEIKNILFYEFHLHNINNIINPILKNKQTKLKVYSEEIENLFTSRYLIKKIKENPEYREKINFIDIDSVLEGLSIRNPIVIKPNPAPKYAPNNLDDIVQELEKKYNWIEVRDQGIYASEDESLYPKQVLQFDSPPVDYEKDFSRDLHERLPQPEDRELLKRLLKQISQLYPKPNEEEVATLGISCILHLFEKHYFLKNKSPFSVIEEWADDYSFVIDLEKCDPRHKEYNNLTIPQRLNFIHNMVIKGFLLAEKQNKASQFIEALNFNPCFIDAYIQNIANFVHTHLIHDNAR